MSDLNTHVPSEQPRPSRKALWFALPLLIGLLIGYVANAIVPFTSIRF